MDYNFDKREIGQIRDSELALALLSVVSILNTAFESPEAFEDVIGTYGEIESVLRDEIVDRFLEREVYRYA